MDGILRLESLKFGDVFYHGVDRLALPSKLVSLACLGWVMEGGWITAEQRGELFDGTHPGWNLGQAKLKLPPKSHL